MDLTPFFRNVDRIATALETIAANTAKPIITHSSNTSNVNQFDVEEIMAKLREPLAIGPYEIGAAVSHSIAGKLTPVEPPAKDEPTVFTPLDDIIRGLYRAGTTTAFGIANKLNEMGRVTEKGRRFNNVNVKPLMSRIGLESTYPSRGVRGAKASATKPEAPAEPAPEPAPARKPVLPGTNHFRERDQKAAKAESDRLNMRSLLSERTRERLEAFPLTTKRLKAEEAKSTSDAELIAQAVADGKVTHCPAFIDSDGFNHFEGSRLNKPKAGFAGVGVHKRGSQYTNRRRG